MYIKLSDHAAQEICDIYFKERFIKTTELKNPKICYVAAQPGAGKSTIGSMLHVTLKTQGGYSR
jgi:pantothenate kinase-related protein Tda10